MTLDARTLTVAGLALGIGCGSAAAQSVYVDFGTSGGTPGSGYGALESGGHWNTITIDFDQPVDFPALTLTSGSTSSVSLHVSRASSFVRTCDECQPPASTPSGDAGALYGDDLSIGSLGDAFTDEFTALHFAGLAEGRYRVTLYGVPATVNGGNGWRSWVQDDEAGTTRSLYFPFESAGTFPPPQEGLTYVRYDEVLTVGGELSIGLRWSHVPFLPGDPFPPIYFDGAFVNGVQLVQLPACPADVNGDGMVNFADLDEVLGAWGTSDPDVDIDHSGTVDFSDLNEVLGAWGAAC